MGLLKNAKHYIVYRKAEKSLVFTSDRNFANNQVSFSSTVIKSLMGRGTNQLPDGTQRIMFKMSEMPDAAHLNPNDVPLENNCQSRANYGLRKYALHMDETASELTCNISQCVCQKLPDVALDDQKPKREIIQLPSRRKVWSVEAVERQVNLPSWAQHIDEAPLCQLQQEETFTIKTCQSELQDLPQNHHRKKWFGQSIAVAQGSLPNWATGHTVHTRHVGSHPQSGIKPFRANPVPATTYKAWLPVKIKQSVKQKVKADVIKDI